MKTFLVLFFLFSFIYLSPESKFQTNRKTYVPGNPIFFQIQMEEDGYIYILNQQSGGTLHLIFPNPDDSDNLFYKGSIIVPSKKAKYEMQIDEDLGEEKFFLLVSKKKIPFFHARNFRDNESILTDNWLRKFTAELLPWEWKVFETKIEIKKKQ